MDHSVVAAADGHCDAVLMWWQLDMLDNTELTLSTAPYWAHPTPSHMQVPVIIFLVIVVVIKG